MGSLPGLDHAIRTAAFAYLDRITTGGEQPVTWAELQRFTFSGQQVHLVSQQGIFKPKELDLPISIRTAPPRTDRDRPYADEETGEGLILYRYRGTDPNHHENRLLRAAMYSSTPLIYLRGISKGLYVADGAVVLDDEPSELAFLVQPLPLNSVAIGTATEERDWDAPARRHYLATVKRRTEQGAFRASVMNAYRSRCSICRLGHEELLDAAHIKPDSQGGPSIVTNGLSLCKIHHAAYDHHILGVRPDHVAEIRTDVLAEVDGPMLRYGLQAVHGQKLHLPRSQFKRPNPEWVEERYEAFRGAP